MVCRAGRSGCPGAAGRSPPCSALLIRGLYSGEHRAQQILPSSSTAARKPSNRSPSNWRIRLFLRQIQCAPTQIHLNAWASMQAFDVLYRAAGLTATMPLFLHFYKTRPTASKGWVSFLEANKSLFTLYLASYKGFKTGFFKVAIPDRGRKYIFDEGVDRSSPYTGRLFLLLPILGLKTA